MEATDILQREHDVVRLVVDAAGREAAHMRATGEVHVGEVERIVEFLREHMRKEEESVFTLVNAYLSDEDRRELAHEFSSVECIEIDAGIHEHYYSLAHQLAHKADD